MLHHFCDLLALGMHLWAFRIWFTASFLRGSKCLLIMWNNNPSSGNPFYFMSPLFWDFLSSKLINLSERRGCDVKWKSFKFSRNPSTERKYYFNSLTLLRNSFNQKGIFRPLKNKRCFVSFKKKINLCYPVKRFNLLPVLYLLDTPPCEGAVILLVLVLLDFKTHTPRF